MPDVSKLLEKENKLKKGGGGGGKGGGRGASTLLCIWQINITMTGVTECNLSANLKPLSLSLNMISLSGIRTKPTAADQFL